MPSFRPAAVAAFLVLSPLCLAAQGPAATQPDSDKYSWLEDVSGGRSMTWVNEHNAATAKILEADPRYSKFYDQAFKLASDPTRLAVPGLRGDEVYNQWRDASNPRGLLRKTSIADYLTATPHWTTVLDYDALGKEEKTGWVGHGLSCLYPGDQYCLADLSAGGEDAVTDREFDLKTAKFVPGGFVSPHSKQSVAWIDKDTLLVTRDWGAGTLTASGYPYIVKEWKRGTPLDSAREVFRGQASDVRASGGVIKDAQGDTLEVFDRGTDFFNSLSFVRTARGVEPLAIPSKAFVAGLIDGRVLIEIRENWTPAGQKMSFIAGSLLEVSLKELLKDPAHLKPAVIFAPTAQEFLEGHAHTRDHILITTLEHVQGRAYVLTHTASGWTRKKLPTPENSSVGIVSASDQDNRFFLSISGFLAPQGVWLGDADKGTITLAKSQPAQFDASPYTVDQYEATSKDGTKVPYFVVHAKGMKLDGSNPTLLNAYGGFEVSETPYYSGTLGKIWLANGGVFVLANIRGGGEFGPAWHEAGLKTKRQRIYDDFAAVGHDLIDRKITSTPHLGIEGGSNGGLLMGVEMEQNPTLWNAVVIQVPLLDMLGFEHIAAGASWVGEYGSVTVPAERAFLASISPYNNLKPDVKYPEPLIFTTTKDDRVGPQHARKFAALMEEYKMPFYYAEITEGGHGSGADIKQQAGSTALTFTYLARKLMQ